MEVGEYEFWLDYGDVVVLVDFVDVVEVFEGYYLVIV